MKQKIQDTKKYFALEVGSAFFVGLSIFLVLWRTLSFVLGTALAPLLIATGICLIVVVCFWKKFLYIKLCSYFRQLKVLFLFFVVVVFFGILYALIPMPNIFLQNTEQTMPAYGFGGIVHSMRAGNISTYISNNNYIPILNQNYGQSLLASIPSFFGFVSPQLSLVVWLNVCLVFLSLVIYGIINFFIKNHVYSIAGSVITMLAGTALYPGYIEIIDTGSTNMLITNIDTIIGLVTFFIFIVSCYFILNRKFNINYLYLVIALCGFVWNIVAAHNMVLAGLFFIVLFFFLNSDTIVMRTKKIGVLCVILFVGWFIGVWQGSMLLPNKFGDKVDIPGTMSLGDNHDEHPLIEIRPKMFLMNVGTVGMSKKVIESIGGGNISVDSGVDVVQEVVFNDMSVGMEDINNSKNKSFSFFTLFKRGRPLRWVVNLTLIFYPVMGLIVFGYFLKYKNMFAESDKKLLKILWSTSVVLFVFGFVCSSFVVLYGKEIEMSRFLGFGNFMAMLFFGLVFAIFLQKRKALHFISRYIIYFIFALSLVGPVVQYAFVGIVGNVVLPTEVDTRVFTLPVDTPYHTLTMYERFDAMLNINTIVGKDFKPQD